jgi:hypothetical protein
MADERFSVDLSASLENQTGFAAGRRPFLFWEQVQMPSFFLKATPT